MLRKLAFSLVMLVLVLTAGELVARMLPASSLVTRDEIVREAAGPQAMIASEAVPGWDIDSKGGEVAGTTFNTNQWMMRGPDYPAEKEPGVERVIFVGDSSVFGVKLAWEETFSARFEALRERRYPNVDYQVANCASPGHSTLQSIYKLERHCLAFQPDVVVIANLFSDSTRYTVPDTERFHTEGFASRPSPFEGLALFRAVRNLLARNVITSAQPPASIGQVDRPVQGDIPRVPVEEYRDNLAREIAMSRAIGATPVLLMLGAEIDVSPTSAVRDRTFQDWREAMREVAAEEGVTLVDGPARYASVAYLPDLFIDAVHPSAAGASVLAVLLHEEIPPPRAAGEP